MGRARTSRIWAAGKPLASQAVICSSSLGPPKMHVDSGAFGPVVAEYPEP